MVQNLTGTPKKRNKKIKSDNKVGRAITVWGAISIMDNLTFQSEQKISQIVGTNIIFVEYLLLENGGKSY